MLESRFIQVMILSLVFCSSCEQNPTVHCTADAFAGKTVSDRNQAADIILTRSQNAPVTGEPAKSGTVFDPVTQQKVELNSLWKERPTVLIFGSGSCTSTNLFGEDIDSLATRFEGKVDFNFIYIREAHPAGGFQPMLQSDFAKEKIPPIRDASSLGERCQAALDFRDRKSFNLKFLVDDMNDPIAASWGAWPTRIFVIGTDGNVIYAGDQGPWYFSVTRKSWHDPPPTFLENEFKKRPFNRESLEEFLERHFGATS